jgi:3-hydroxyacyl-CoA dehydrogenase
MIDPVTYTREDDLAVIRIDNPPVNALGRNVRAGLVSAMDRFDDDAGAKVAIVTGAGLLFSGGADIREFDGPRIDPSLTCVTLRFDSATKPVIAAIQKTAFGGALELALSCHFRICDGSAQFGLPEVKLGIFAGAGGTQRLPRLIGLQQALEMIVQGEPVAAPKARQLGIVDAIADGDLLGAAQAFARNIINTGPVLKRTCDPIMGPGMDAKAQSALAAARLLAAKRMRGRDAPLRAIDSVENGLTTTFETALFADRKIVDALKVSPQSRALRYAFFAERQAAKIPDIAKDTTVRPINSAGVIGAGTMGSGIAVNLADVGIPVTVIETTEAALKLGARTIEKIYDRMVDGGRISDAERDRRLRLISTSTSYDDLAQVDLVIEAVFEDLDLKKRIFSRLDEICQPGVILATNSSSLDINEIAATTRRPQDVCGLHFFSPANIMKLLEIVRADKSADDVIATAMALAKRIGKVGVLAGVCSGYVANRSRQPMVQEAMFLVEDGASPEQVDRALVGFGMPMGPLAVADLAGTDISYSVRKSQQSRWDPQARYPCLADRIVEAGRHGRKVGRGWYRYDDALSRPATDPDFAKIATEYRAERGITPCEFTDEEILERCLLAAVNEATHILEEGKVLRASDIDVMWLTGFAFPRHRGGIMHHADQIGLAHVYARICKFRQEMGEQWKPSDLLKQLAEKGGSFADI